MEHVVQFGINIDDESIKRAIINNVQTQVTKDLKNEIVYDFTGRRDADKIDFSNKVKSQITDSIDRYIEMWKDEIIETASIRLADRLSKTKAVKAILEDQLKDI